MSLESQIEKLNANIEALIEVIEDARMAVRDSRAAENAKAEEPKDASAPSKKAAIKKKAAAKKAKVEQAEVEDQPEVEDTDTETAPPISYEDLAASVVALAKMMPEGRAKALEILGEYDAKKADGIPEDKWAEAKAKFDAARKELEDA